MTNSLVYHLVAKDWYLQRWTIASGLGAGVFCLALLSVPNVVTFYSGALGLLTVLITVSVQLVFSTVLNERKEQTLAFVMSLPITPYDYTLSKLLSNMTIFLLLWLALVGGTVGVILVRPALPNGLIPFAVITFGEILTSSCLVLATSIMTESQGWAVAALITGNLSVNAFIFGVGQIKSISGTISGPVAVWSPAALAAVGIEAVLIVVLVALTFYVQGRKTSFL